MKDLPSSSSNHEAPNQKLVRVDADNPSIENWVDVIPHKEHVLSISRGFGYFFAEYMVDAISKVFQYDCTGTLIREIELPGVGSVSGFSGKKDDELLYYRFTTM